MSIIIHTTQIVGGNNAGSQISSTAYNAGHTINSKILPYGFIVSYDTTSSKFQVLNQYGVLSDGTETHADAAIQYAVTQLASIGGFIIIRNNAANGDYSIYTAIDLSGTNNITIIGERGAKLILNAANGQTVAQRTIFYASGLTNCRIQGLILDGNYLNVSAWLGSAYGLIYLQGNCSHINIVDNDFNNARSYGITVDAYAGQKIYDVNTQGNRFNGGGFWNSIYYLAWDSGAGNGIYGCDISFNDIQNFCDIGIDLGQYSTGTVTRCNVHDNRVHDGNTTGLGSGGGTDAIIGIRTEGTTYYCDIHDNIIYKVRSGFADDASGMHSNWHNNTAINDLSGATDVTQFYGSYQTVRDNDLFGGYTDWFSGINVNCSNTKFLNNKIYNLGGSTHMGGISENAVLNNNTMRGNILTGMTAGWISFSTGTGTKAMDNEGYNPLGAITNFVPAAGNYFVDSGSSATVASATTYTNKQSPKTLYIKGGTVTVIAHNGVTLYAAATTATILLEPGDTFSITYTVAPTIVMMGR